MDPGGQKRSWQAAFIAPPATNAPGSRAELHLSERVTAGAVAGASATALYEVAPVVPLRWGPPPMDASADPPPFSFASPDLLAADISEQMDIDLTSMRAQRDLLPRSVAVSSQRDGRSASVPAAVGRPTPHYAGRQPDPRERPCSTQPVRTHWDGLALAFL